MSDETSKRQATYGYLSTWESAEHECLGGYLIVSHVGRPLEFHCTAPIRPSRAQQILFGPTLWPYVLGEQIGGTLLTEAKLRPNVVLVDHPAALSLRQRAGAPLAWISQAGSRGQGAGSDEQQTGDDMAASRNATIEVPTGYDAERALIEQLLAPLAEFIDLVEPFGRIREAISEAQRIGGRGADAHEQAA